MSREQLRKSVSEQGAFEFTERPVSSWSEEERVRVAAQIRENRKNQIPLTKIQQQYVDWMEDITPEYDDKPHRGM